LRCSLRRREDNYALEQRSGTQPHKSEDWYHPNVPLGTVGNRTLVQYEEKAPLQLSQSGY
jgi:hypothetical protein